MRFVVSDGRTQVNQLTTILIAPANQPPSLVVPVSQNVREGERVLVRLTARDAEASPLEFSSSFLPGGAFLDPHTGIFDWTPGFFQAGTYEIDFDGSGFASGIYFYSIKAREYSEKKKMIFLK